MTDFWSERAAPAPESIAVAGGTIRRLSRVRLRPRGGGDVWDLALAGRLAVVDSIEEDAEGGLHVAVTLDDDPGRDLGAARALGHRFFFRPEELEPVDGGTEAVPRRPAILVAGIGNLFLGDDGFGVEVVKRLGAQTLRHEVVLRDFGIRGLDLAYELQQDWDAAILVDAAPRGAPPGTLSVIEPAVPAEDVVLDTHGLDPLRVLLLARALGHVPERLLVVACEPGTIVRGEHDDDLVGALSEPVAAAVDGAARLVVSLVDELLDDDRKAVKP